MHWVNKDGYRLGDFSWDISKFLRISYDLRKTKSAPKNGWLELLEDENTWFGKQRLMGAFFHPSITPCCK